MASNSFGTVFRITTAGESHGKALTCIVDGCPPGLELSEEDIQPSLDKRMPGQSKIVTQRKEKDQVEILSGVFEGVTTGHPITLQIQNTDQRSKDYSHIKNFYRPSHADFTYSEKYGIRDYRGGGRSSARETANWVGAGAVANKFLKEMGIEVNAFVSQVHNLKLEKHYSKLDLSKTYENDVRCPDGETAEKMIDLIKEVKKDGDSVGGVITGVIKNCKVGLGDPIFEKLSANLGKAMLTINAVKGFEIGSGFESTTLKGSEHNDMFDFENDRITTKTNNAGGVLGGISSGQDIYFRVAFKPTATVIKDQDSVNAAGEKVVVEGKGRHDPCVLPRAVPIVEALSALVVFDHYLMNKTYL
jgi:chorismate synthase